jgi:nucleoside-diphosphate-sugar epimerase|tara:strand:- start:3845 stop:4741 length:897 start_codon:yes stop_codon:yes gene_type:complete
MKLIVFGGRGFIGSNLIQRLERREGLELFAPSSQAVDLRDGDALENYCAALRPDAVVNLAGSSFAGAGADYQTLFQVNAFGQFNLLRCLRKIGFAGRMLFASSANVYGSGQQRVAFCEAQALAPMNEYGCSKALAEHFCGLFKHDFPVCIARPFNCIGRGQKSQFLIPKIARAFAEASPVLELGNLSIERDYLDVRDAAGMLEALLFNETFPAKVNLAANETHSILQIVQAFADIAGRELKVVVNPEFIRPNDLIYQRGLDQVIRSCGYQKHYDLKTTLRWIYRAADEQRQQGQGKLN